MVNPYRYLEIRGTATVADDPGCAGRDLMRANGIRTRASTLRESTGPWLVSDSANEQPRAELPVRTVPTRSADTGQFAAGMLQIKAALTIGVMAEALSGWRSDAHIGRRE